MKKTLATLIDELTVTNIKIFHLMEEMEEKHHEQDPKKLKDLDKYRLELRKAIDLSKTMKKSMSSIVDELTITNIKIFHLVGKIEKGKHTLEDAKKAHELNRYRSKLCNALNREFKERENIKV